ncbi:hypothetical protein CL656_01570 [bacterium]|nr:hypothetical protein [bacterium]
MKTRICKILNIMVLIYIFNSPMAFSDLGNSPDIKLQAASDVEVINEVVGDPSLDEGQILENTSSDLNVNENVEISNSNDSNLLFLNSNITDTQNTPVQSQESEPDNVDQILYTNIDSQQPDQVIVDNNLQQEKLDFDISDPQKVSLDDNPILDSQNATQFEEKSLKNSNFETIQEENDTQEEIIHREEGVIVSEEALEQEDVTLEEEIIPQEETEIVQEEITPQEENVIVQEEIIPQEEAEIVQEEIIPQEETEIVQEEIIPQEEDTIIIEEDYILEAENNQSYQDSIEDQSPLNSVQIETLDDKEIDSNESVQASQDKDFQEDILINNQEVVLESNNQKDNENEVLDLRKDKDFSGNNNTYQSNDLNILKDSVSDSVTESNQNIEESIEKTTEHKKYTLTIPLLKDKDASLSIQLKELDESTTQIVEINNFQTVYLELKPNKKQKVYKSNLVKDYGLFEKVNNDKLLVVDSFEFIINRRESSSKSPVLIDKNYEDIVDVVDISKYDINQESKTLSSEAGFDHANIIAFASHDLKMDSLKKTDLSSTDQAFGDLQNKQNSLDFLDKVHPSKVSQDLNADGCADLIENSLEFRKFCNFLDHNTANQNDRLSLNLDSIKNVFNTQKVVLNGVAKANSKIELHLVSVDSDKILSILESDRNGNFIYLLDSNLVPSKAKFYLKDEFSNVSQDYSYTFDFSMQKQSPKILKLCGQNYESGNVVLCNPKEGFDIKLKSEYQTLTKAYFNSVIHTAMVATNNTQDIAVLNPDSKIKSDLKSGEVHRVILQNFDPLNPGVLSEPVEIFYKVHYPIINPVLLPLFVLLFLLAVVILYDYLIYSYQDLNSKLIYESYQVFKNSDISHSSN